MGDAIGQSMPIAVGVLVSPMPIVALVLMLVSRRARANGIAFLLGWLEGIYVVGAVVLLLAGAVSGGDQPAPPWASWVKIVLGVLLLLMSVRQWQGRPRAGEPALAPEWMKAIDDFTAMKSFGLAFALGAVNPKNLLLVVSGAAAIATATADASDRFLALLVFTVVASLGIIVPLVIYVGMGDRAAHLLDELKTWMTDNNAAITAVLLLVLGAKVLGDGVTGL